MSALRLRRGELKRAQHLAHMCEMHAGEALKCSEAGNTGAWLAHDGIARQYAVEAFHLSDVVSSRAHA